MPHITEYNNFHGFGTVQFYESECRKAGQEVTRVPCLSPDGAPCIMLLTACPGASERTFDGIDIVTADESHCLYSGSARHGADYQSILPPGYILSAVPAPVAFCETIVDGEPQLSLF